MEKAKLGEAIAFSLVVENTSDHDIKFSASDLLQSATAELIGPDDKPINVQRIWFSGFSPISRWWLKSKERVVIARPSFQFLAEGGALGEHIAGQSHAFVKAGEYRLHYSVGLGQGAAWFRQDDGVMRRVMPAKGEWTGQLVSQFATIAIE